MANKNEAFYAIIALAILIGGLYYFSGSNLLSSAGNPQGFATLSLSPVDVISDDPNLNGKAILMSVVADNSGEFASGTLPAGTTLPNGEKTTNSFTIKIDNLAEQCTYSVTRTNNVLSKLVKYEITVNPIILLPSDQENDARRQCNEKGGSEVFVGRYYIQYNHFMCIRAVQTYGEGYVASKQLEWQSRITFSTGDGKSSSTTISNQIPAANINNIVYTKNVGLVGTGQECSEYSGAGVIYGAAAQNDKVIDNSKLTIYHATTFSDIKNQVSPIVGGTVEVATSNYMIQQIIDAWNNRHDAAVNSVLPQFSGATSDHQNKIVLSLQNPIKYPYYQFLIKADWIGINIPVLDVRAISCSPQTVEAGYNSPTRFVVKNNGGVAGQFSVRLGGCQSGIQSSVNNFYIDANAQQEYSLLIGNSRKTDETCNLVVSNRVGTTSTTQCHFVFTQPIVGTPTAIPTGTVTPNECGEGYHVEMIDNLSTCVKDEQGIPMWLWFVIGFIALILLAIVIGLLTKKKTNLPIVDNVVRKVRKRRK